MSAKPDGENLAKFIAFIADKFDYFFESDEDAIVMYNKLKVIIK